ncbi:hypothetical protein AADZ91_05785 [Colwelliaceae bacterium 6441]
MKFINNLVVLFTLSTSFICSANIIFINEIHYDNKGTDTNEFIEIAGQAGHNLNGWSIELYNGSGGARYGDIINLSGVLSDDNNGLGFAAFFPSYIQNGSPDGLALINDVGKVIQFLSYEGVITATNGAANGMVSTDIGVSESGKTTADNFSLQLMGYGNHYQDFTWRAAEHSKGFINKQQRILPTVSTITVSEPGSLILLCFALLVLSSQCKQFNA